MKWTELPADERPQGASWSATATADDGAELQIDVFGRRPSAFGVIQLHQDGAPAVPQWLVSSSRPPTLLEAIDAVREAAGGSPEWWAVPFPFRADLEPAGGDPPRYQLGGMLVGPIPPGRTAAVQLAIGGGEALATSLGASHG